MALVIPARRNQAYARNYSGRPASTWGTLVTASGTPHALTGTETEIIASTAYEAEWILIMAHSTQTPATLTNGLLNIYIGGSGSEVLLIDSLQVGFSAAPTDGRVPRQYWFPLRIPRGSRISAEYRALIASDTVRVMIDYGVFNGGHWVGSGVETLGEDTGNSRGTSVTPGSSSEGTFTSIGTTGRRWRYLILASMGNNDTTLLSSLMAWDVGVSGAVYQGLENFMQPDNSEEYQTGMRPFGAFCDIPSGTALEARGQGSGNPSGLQYVTLYGVY